MQLWSAECKCAKILFFESGASPYSRLRFKVEREGSHLNFLFWGSGPLKFMYPFYPWKINWPWWDPLSPKSDYAFTSWCMRMEKPSRYDLSIIQLMYMECPEFLLLYTNVTVALLSGLIHTSWVQWPLPLILWLHPLSCALFDLKGFGCYIIGSTPWPWWGASDG